MLTAGVEPVELECQAFLGRGMNQAAPRLAKFARRRTFSGPISDKPHPIQTLPNSSAHRYCPVGAGLARDSSTAVGV
jgi:hypothetical protein